MLFPDTMRQHPRRQAFDCLRAGWRINTQFVQAPQTEIIVTKEGVELARRVVAPGEYVFGREGDVDFRIETPLLSRQHARLSVNFDEWLIEDLGSANGTFINDQPVAPNETKRIFPTQTLRLGDATVTLRRLRGSEAPDVSLAPNVAALRALLPEEMKERRYTVGSVVAQGGMGAILSAEDRAIRRDVAMKVMLYSGVGSEDLVRFVEEAQITGQLEHPNIVPVYELGVDEQDQPFYTMKFVRGVSLRKIVELLAQNVDGTVKKYPLPVLLTILQKVCDGMAFAHSKGVIHRDLKPENIMLGEYGEALVMDWGLAKVVGAPMQPGENGPRVARPTVRSARQDDPGSVTLSGSIMGTPQFMSPEQASGEIERLDARTDIYALGAILYQLLTLEPPIAAGNVDALLDDVRAGRITPPLQRLGARKLAHLPGGRVPESLAAVAMKAMALQPDARYPSVQAFQADIAAYQNGFATTAEHAGLAKQLTLLIKRHKVASAAVVLIVTLTAGFMAKVVSSERKATAHLARLKGTAPTFEHHARALIEKSASEPETLAEALGNADHAIELAPERADYHALRGGILQAMLRLDEARTAFATALKLDPANASAKANLTLCEQALARRLADGSFPTDTLSSLAAALRQQQRGAEALAVMRTFESSGGAKMAIWQERLNQAGLKDTLTLQPDGELFLLVSKTPDLQDLSALRGIPLNRLTFVTGRKVTDISPLAEMPLRILEISNTTVTDLSPLQGMQLERLILSPGVSDLSPLRGMPLRDLATATTSKVTDFSILRELPLTSLTVHNSVSFKDLSVLAGKPITSLRINSTGIRDFTSMRAMPLEYLEMTRMPSASLADLSFIPTAKLKKLEIGTNVAVRDLSALRGAGIEELLVNTTSVTDLSPLATMSRLKSAQLSETMIGDLTPLGGLDLQRLALDRCPRLRSVAPLARMANLQVLALPPAAHDVELLRGMKSLTWIGYGNPPQISDGGRMSNAVEFWPMHDLEKQLRAAEPDGKLRPGKFPHMKTRFPMAQQLGGHWYAWFGFLGTWEEARECAEKMGGHLATVTSEEEYQFTRNLANSLFGNGVGYCVWLGAFTDKPGAEWHWVTGEPWTFTRWTKRDGIPEPSGILKGTQMPETVLGIGDYNGNLLGENANRRGWNDLAHDDPTARGFIVEWED